jgi:hypothetical protein
MIMMKNCIYNIKHYYNITDIDMLKTYLEKRIQYTEKLALKYTTDENNKPLPKRRIFSRIKS